MFTIRTISTVCSMAFLLGAAPATPQGGDCCETPSRAAFAKFTAGPSTQPAGAKQDAAALYAKLASLAGTWTSTDADMKCEFEYSTTGGGSTVVENQNMHGGMMTMYSLDGDRVVLTHYCGAGNQPRMAATGIDGDTASFKYVDSTGMKSANDPHMHELTITFAADGTIEQNWTMYADGKEAGVVTIKLKKSV